MKNRVLFVFLAMVLVVSLAAFAACKAEEAPPVVEEEEAPPVVEEEEPPVVEEVWEWPTAYQRVLTPGTWSSTHLVVSAWAPLMEADTGLKWRLVPESTSAIAARWLITGDAEFMATYYDVPWNSIAGNLGYAARDLGPFPVRLVADIEILTSTLVVMGDSPIKSSEDIEDGMRMARWVGSPTMMLLWEAIRVCLDKELIPVDFADYGAFCRSISEGKADLVWMGPGAAIYIQLAASPRGLRPIEFPRDPEANKRWLDFYIAPLREGAAGPLKGLWVITGSNPLVTLDKTDPELVYRIVEWLYDSENYARYVEKYPAAVVPTLEQFVEAIDYTLYPVHEGTIRFLKEKGLWTPHLELHNEHNTKLLEWYTRAYRVAIDRADESGLRIDPANEAWVTLWQDYQEEIGLLEYWGDSMTDEELTERLKVIEEGLKRMR